MRVALFIPLLLATACNDAGESSGVTAEEAAELNAAADLLDINAADPDLDIENSAKTQ